MATADLDKEILKEFQEESKTLISYMLEILETVEGNFKQVQRLEDYGQNVDRIMGGAKSLALAAPPGHFVHKIGDYAALCKAVGYKASQIKDNPGFFDICVALLLDATEMLEEMIENLDGGESQDMKAILSSTFLDRLRWVSSQFSPDVRASVEIKKDEAKVRMNQTEIDELLKKILG